MNDERDPLIDECMLTVCCITCRIVPGEPIRTWAGAIPKNSVRIQWDPQNQPDHRVWSVQWEGLGTCKRTMGPTLQDCVQQIHDQFDNWVEPGQFGQVGQVGAKPTLSETGMLDDTGLVDYTFIFCEKPEGHDTVEIASKDQGTFGNTIGQPHMFQPENGFYSGDSGLVIQPEESIMEFCGRLKDYQLLKMPIITIDDNEYYREKLIQGDDDRVTYARYGSGHDYIVYDNELGAQQWSIWERLDGTGYSFTGPTIGACIQQLDKHRSQNENSDCDSDQPDRLERWGQLLGLTHHPEHESTDQFRERLKDRMITDRKSLRVNGVDFVQVKRNTSQGKTQYVRWAHGNHEISWDVRREWDVAWRMCEPGITRYGPTISACVRRMKMTMEELNQDIQNTKNDEH